MVHALDASWSGHKGRSIDTDVVVLAISVVNTILWVKPRIAYSSGKLLHKLPVHTIAMSLGEGSLANIPCHNMMQYRVIFRWMREKERGKCFLKYMYNQFLEHWQRHPKISVRNTSQYLRGLRFFFITEQAAWQSSTKKGKNCSQKSQESLTAFLQSATC